MIKRRSLEEIEELREKLEELREEAKDEMERISERLGPMAAINPDYLVGYTTVITVKATLDTLAWSLGEEMEFSAILQAKTLAEEAKERR